MSLLQQHLIWAIAVLQGVLRAVGIVTWWINGQCKAWDQSSALPFPSTPSCRPQSALHGENMGSDVSWTPELTKNQRLKLIPMSQWLCCRFLSQVKRSTCSTVESHCLQGNITSLCVAAGLEGLELYEPLGQLLVLLDGCFPSCCAKFYSLGKRKQLKPPQKPLKTRDVEKD